MTVSPVRYPVTGSPGPVSAPQDQLPPGPVLRPVGLLSPGPVLAWVEPPAGVQTSQILVVDDNVTFAEVLASRLEAEPGLRACVATTVEQAHTVLADHGADLMLFSVDLDKGDGMQFAREVRSGSPGVRVVAVAGGEGESQIVEAVRIGVCGWVPKDEPVEYLLSAVRGALRGETWIPPRLLTRVLAEIQSAQRDGTALAQLLTTLTGREREILDCLVSGMNRDSIAQYLYLSRNTVRTHIQNMLRKLGVHSTLAAVALARRAGLGQLG
jgi:DNA-binding NarL/FixJ family response regulator